MDFNSVPVLAEEVDPLEFEEAVDVLAALPNTWFEEIEAAGKWQEKKAKLEELIAVADTPKIADGDFDELVRVLNKMIKDSNINVAQTAIRAVTCLGTGLKTPFAKYSKVTSHHVYPDPLTSQCPRRPLCMYSIFHPLFAPTVVASMLLVSRCCCLYARPRCARCFSPLCWKSSRRKSPRWWLRCTMPATP